VKKKEKGLKFCDRLIQFNSLLTDAIIQQRQYLTTKARVRSHTNHCAIFGEQCGTGTRCLHSSTTDAT